MHPARVEIRSFLDRDIEFALSQTAREGWEATGELFESLLAHDPDGCFIAELDGRRAGMISTTAYARSVWIGNLIVVPQCRRQGVGLHLMTYAMAYLTSLGIAVMQLEADPPGVKMYRRLGFVDEFDSPRFENLQPIAREQVSLAASPHVERLDRSRLTQVASFDAQYFGDDRSRLLSLLFKHARAGYCVAEGGTVRAYAMALPSAFGIRIGPWVGADDTAARAVLSAILSEFPSERYCIGVPSVNGDAIELLTSLGLQQTSSCLRMVYGDAKGRYPSPAVEAMGRPHAERIYGIAGGAMG